MLISKQYNYKNIFTYELLWDLYINKRMTSRQIAKLYNTTKTKVLLDLKRLGISYDDVLNSYKINDLQHDLLIGSKLGDGTFVSDGGDYRASFRQAENQKDYLQYKFEIMEEFCKKKSVSISDGNKKASKSGVAQLMYYFHTRALPIFNDYKIMSNIDALNQLNNNSFAIWLMDDGSLSHRESTYIGNYTLSTKRFSEEEYLMAQNILVNKIGLDAKISYMKNDYYKNGRKYLINGFYFPVSETEKIHSIITNSDFGERLKVAMSYKLLS